LATKPISLGGSPPESGMSGSGEAPGPLQAEMEKTKIDKRSLWKKEWNLGYLFMMNLPGFQIDRNLPFHSILRKGGLQEKRIGWD
jgi:hypothetical protein